MDGYTRGASLRLFSLLLTANFPAGLIALLATNIICYLLLHRYHLLGIDGSWISDFLFLFFFPVEVLGSLVLFEIPLSLSLRLERRV